jgi:Protein of unknown function (DUF551)
MQKDKNGWISIHDAVPELLEDVLVVVGNTQYVGYMDLITRRDHRWTVSNFRTDTVSHWQPLPGLPEKK